MSYTFKTIVATEEIRTMFTKLRNELNTSDKDLMTAFWTIGMSQRSELEEFVNTLKEDRNKEKLEKKEQKLAAKRKAQADKPKGKRGRPAGAKTNKAAPVKADTAEVLEHVVDVPEDDEAPIVVVDARQ